MLKHAMGDIPDIGTSNYTSTAYQGLGTATTGGMVHIGETAGSLQRTSTWRDSENDSLSQITRAAMAQKFFLNNRSVSTNEKDTEMAEPKRRIVKVIIIDPDDRVPLDQCILYSGEEKLTDSTDQELFFELDIKSMLDAHNAKRTQIVDKSVKERTEMLDAVKVRDLKMVVVNVAEF